MNTPSQVPERRFAFSQILTIFALALIPAFQNCSPMNPPKVASVELSAAPETEELEVRNATQTFGDLDRATEDLLDAGEREPHGRVLMTTVAGAYETIDAATAFAGANDGRGE